MLSLPNTIAAGDPAVASKIQGNFQYLLDALQTITNDLLGLNSVASGNIQDNAVTTPKIQDGAVTTPKLAALAVTTAKVADSAVTLPKMAANSVDATKIVSNTLVRHTAQGPTVIVNGGNSTFTFTGYDTTVYPNIMVYYGVGTPYRVLLGVDDTVPTAMEVRVQIALSGANYVVTVYNDTGGALTFTVVAVGLEA